MLCAGDDGSGAGKDACQVRATFKYSVVRNNLSAQINVQAGK